MENKDVFFEDLSAKAGRLINKMRRQAMRGVKKPVFTSDRMSGFIDLFVSDINADYWAHFPRRAA